MAAKINDKITPMLTQIQRDLQQLPQEAYEYFRRQTPVSTGNARRNTRLSNDTIIADYQYAQRLDQGASRQAPQGMVEPTEQYLAKRYQDITKDRR